MILKHVFLCSSAPGFCRKQYMKERGYIPVMPDKDSEETGVPTR